MGESENTSIGTLGNWGDFDVRFAAKTWAGRWHEMNPHVETWVGAIENTGRLWGSVAFGWTWDDGNGGRRRDISPNLSR